MSQVPPVCGGSLPPADRNEILHSDRKAGQEEHTHNTHTHNKHRHAVSLSPSLPNRPVLQLQLLTCILTDLGLLWPVSPGPTEGRTDITPGIHQRRPRVPSGQALEPCLNMSLDIEGDETTKSTNHTLSAKGMVQR